MGLCETPIKSYSIQSFVGWAGHVACMGNTRGVYRVFVGRSERKTPLRRPRHRWEINNKIDIQEVGWGGMDWITWPKIGKCGGRL